MVGEGTIQSNKSSDNGHVCNPGQVAAAYSVVNDIDAGNVAHLPIQCKHPIGAVNDPLEQEADNMADTVMRMPEAAFSGGRRGEAIQPKCADCEEEETVRRMPQAPFYCNRNAGNEAIQTKNHNNNASDSVTNQINTTRGSGSNMDSATQSFMQSRFGTNFSNVKIHTDNDAVQMSRELNAQAFTVGNDIYFNEGKYNPLSESGRHLLAHELTHTVQQSGGIAKKIQKQEVEGDTAPPVVDGGLSREMLVQIARRLYKAMDGLGTDEDAIYSTFAGRTTEQSDAIARVYQEQYGHTLLSDLQDELSESELGQLAAFTPTLVPGGVSAAIHGGSLATSIAMQLNNAMDRAGTWEDSIMAALTGRTQAELTAIKDAYVDLTTRSLESDLRDELSGSDLTQALRLLNQGLLEPEDELYLAMEGLGTDEATIFRVLEGMAGNNAGITAMEDNYRTKYGDLIADLRGDLSGGDYRRAMRVLRLALQDAAFQDCPTDLIPEIRTAIALGIQKTDHAIEVLARGLDNMIPAELVVFNRFFDPGGTGNIDQRFVSDVLSNFRNIRREYDNDLIVECEASGGLCGGNLYYTYWSNIHLCEVAFRSNTDPVQKARDFMHELGHNAMQSVDRVYYPLDPTDIVAATNFAALTPRGNIAAQIPVLGPLIGLIVRSDTLYNPDSYSWFAFEVP